MLESSTNLKNLKEWEKIFRQKMAAVEGPRDPAHDLLHTERVVWLVKRLSPVEGANPFISVPAAWFHDFVWVSKEDSNRSLASRLSARAAGDFLKEIEYPEVHLPGIVHAIEAHSYSAKITCESIEAKVLQDADRLDALGVIGVARCFAVAGQLGRSFYASEDPFCEHRELQDELFAIDHFYKKLLQLPSQMHTQSAILEAKSRMARLRLFLEQLRAELPEARSLERETTASVSMDFV